jgi:hypothetical protein
MMTMMMITCIYKVKQQNFRFDYDSILWSSADETTALAHKWAHTRAVWEVRGLEAVRRWYSEGHITA